MCDNSGEKGRRTPCHELGPNPVDLRTSVRTQVRVRVRVRVTVRVGIRGGVMLRVRDYGLG